jgi:hypothetical protein
MIAVDGRLMNIEIDEDEAPYIPSRTLVDTISRTEWKIGAKKMQTTFENHIHKFLRLVSSSSVAGAGSNLTK